VRRSWPGAGTVPGMTAATALADDLLDAMYERDPLFATLTGNHDRDDRLADLSPAGDAAAGSRFAGILARARTLDPTGLSTVDAMTGTVVVAHAEAALDRLATRAVEYTVTPTFFVAPAAQLLVGLPQVPVTERAHADGYLARLAAVPAFLGTLADRHRAGVAAGRLPVRRLVDAAVAHLDRYLDDRAGTLRRPTYDDAFAADRDRLVADVVHPALARYRAALAEELAPSARPDDRAGLCWLPDGEADYDRLLRAHTTLDRTPEELHRTGLDLLDRLAWEYRTVGGRVFGPIGLPDLFARLRADPALRWRDAAAVLATARSAVARAERAAPDWFGRLPRQRCRVEPVPDAEAPHAPAAYYHAPALDGSRPGVYYVNTYRAAERDRYSAEAMAFHETVPGHHCAVALAHEVADLPALRRVVHFDAFGEGWGLYAERLADEMGLYSDDVARLGLLAVTSLRAARLVVDTGLHAFGWDRARAVAFLRSNTPLADVDVEQETDRYLADPGQAVAYLVGRLEFDRLRTAARRALGGRFDLKGFHDAVLAGGEIPLGALAGVVDRWVTSVGGPPAGTP
jgi:uncharacterized protein (DUF885 family)